jgi:hypothetical protein
MAVSEYFAHSYSEARAKFLTAACAAGSHLDHYVLPNFRGPNPNDEDNNPLSGVLIDAQPTAFLMQAGRIRSS